MSILNCPHNNSAAYGVCPLCYPASAGFNGALGPQRDSGGSWTGEFPAQDAGYPSEEALTRMPVEMQYEEAFDGDMDTSRAPDPRDLTGRSSDDVLKQEGEPVVAPRGVAPLYYCFNCEAAIREPGGLLFSPPRPDGTVKKLHICTTCWSDLGVE